ncbi:hypothetical protein, partial [Neisseria dentiae]|uniref:hypothetical protein n=1 Tax=Neisseria dentiae TaxID=194197 RepID=UPI0035A0B97C
VIVSETIFFNDKYQMTHQIIPPLAAHFIWHPDDSLKYSLTGIFHNDTFCVNNISFKDEELLKLFPHLEGELITLEVDRLDIGLWASKKT